MNAQSEKLASQGGAKGRRCVSALGGYERGPTGRSASEIAPPDLAFRVPNSLPISERDLFGELVRPGFGRPGRPRHMPTPATRARVIELRGQGLSHLAIAAAIGVSHPTMLLNYADDLGSNSQTGRRRAARDRKENRT